MANEYGRRTPTSQELYAPTFEGVGAAARQLAPNVDVLGKSTQGNRALAVAGEEYGKGNIAGAIGSGLRGVGGKLVGAAGELSRAATLPVQAAGYALGTGAGAVSDVGGRLYGGLTGEYSGPPQVSPAVTQSAPTSVAQPAPTPVIQRAPAPQPTYRAALEPRPGEAGYRSEYNPADYVQPGAPAAQAAPFSYVEQLKKMQAIDPATYGHPEGYEAPPPQPDPNTMNLGEMLAAGAKYRNYMQSQEAAKARGGAAALEGARGVREEKLAGMREAGETTRAGLREKAAAALEEKRGSREERLAGMHEAGTESRFVRGATPSALQQVQAQHEGQKLADLQEAARVRADLDTVARHLVTEKDPSIIAALVARQRHLQSQVNPRSWQEDVARGKLQAEYAAAGLSPTGEPIIGHANGGVIQGYADGGAVGQPQTQTQQLHPAVAQYGQYLTAATRAGVFPVVSFSQYLNMLQTTRTAANQAPAQFADGGDVSALNRPISGPGTGTSDSIPAVIGGSQPAALSDGEFVIPEHVVRAKGTEFFEKLIAQYTDKKPASGSTSFALGGSVEDQQRDEQGYSVSTFNPVTGGYDSVAKGGDTPHTALPVERSPLRTTYSEDKPDPNDPGMRTWGSGTQPMMNREQMAAKWREPSARISRVGSTPADAVNAPAIDMQAQRDRYISGIRESSPVGPNEELFSRQRSRPGVI